MSKTSINSIINSDNGEMNSLLDGIESPQYEAEYSTSNGREPPPLSPVSKLK